MVNARSSKSVIVFRSQAGNEPFTEWLNSLHEAIVFLFCGGSKDSQRRDIQRAQAYWQEYQSHG